MLHELYSALGFIFWIDYMIDPDRDPPPLITTLTPSPINPKEIWNEHYNIDTENNLAMENKLEAAGE